MAMTCLLTWALAFAVMTAGRLGLAWRYAVARRGREQALGGTAADVTIVQPILSGDPALAGCLGDNLDANREARFLWLVDEDDGEGLAITRALVAAHPAARVEILAVPPPRDGENPKMAKLIVAAREVGSGVLLVLDDDTVLPRWGAGALAEQAAGGALATGLPVYVSHATLAERLVAGMINGQAFATYFAMAAAGANRTISGMVYAVSVADLRAAGGFAAAGHELTDDWAVARLMQSHGRPIEQTAVVARVVISFETLSAAARVVRRWLIFANRYLSRNAGPATLTLVVMPSLWPLLGVVPAVAAGWPGALVWPAALAAKALVNGLLLQRVAGLAASPSRILCETAADVLMPILYLTALVRPRHLTWRRRRMELRGDTIHYH